MDVVTTSLVHGSQKQRTNVRPEEFQQLTSAMEAVREGQSLTVQLTGEPGSGKTALLTRLAAEARTRGYTVLRASCTESAKSKPIQGFAQLLTSESRTRDSETRLKESAPLLRSLVDCSTVHTGRSPTYIPGDPRCRLMHRVRSLLDGWAENGLVLIVDDLHWADPDTLEVLEHLVSWPLNSPVLLVLAHRTRPAPHPLHDTLVHAAEIGTAQRIDLAPLSSGQSAELLGLPAGSPVLHDLHRAAHGNPLYLLALAEARHRHTTTGCGTPDEPPGWLTSRLLGELAPLTDEESAAAAAAAVMGDTFAMEELEEVAGLDADGACRAIDNLCQRDVFRPASGGTHLRFRHPLLRRVVYTDTDPCWRTAAQRRAVALMARSGTPAAELAPLLEQMLPGPGAQERVLFARAAREILADDPVSAARLLRLALRALPEGERHAAERAELMTALVRALAMSGELRENIGQIQEILDRIPSAAGAPRARAVAFYSLLECALGRHTQALSTLAGETGAGPGPETPEGAALTVAQQLVAFLSGVPADDRRLDAALRSARDHGDRATEAGALAALALSRMADAGPDLAAAALDECAAAVDALTGPTLDAHPEYPAALGWAESVAGRRPAAERHLVRAVAIASASHDTHLLAPYLINLSYVRYQSGRLIEAQRTAAEARRIAGRLRLGFPLHIATAMEAAYTASIVQDGPSTRRAAALTESVLTRIGPRDSALRISSALWLADAAREFIDPGRLTTIACAVFGGPELVRVPTWLRPLGFDLLAEASARAGRPDPEWADRAEAAASLPGTPLLRAHALAARAHVLTRSAAAAADRYQEAAKLFASAGMARHQAHALILAAPRLSTAGRRPESGFALDRAKEIAQASGARSMLARVDEERRRLIAQRREPPREPLAAVSGPDVPDPDAPDPGTRLTALTDREHEVANLAGAGKRTREIAELLQLSPRTVDVHLTRIYRKLDLHSRAALARFMAQAG